MENRKPRGSGRGPAGQGRKKSSTGGSRRTPAPGKKGGPFRGENYDRNLGAVRKKGRGSGVGQAGTSITPTSPVHDPEGIRLQKVLASAGVASRRVCEDLMAEGRVEVNGQIVTEPGVRVNPDQVSIHVDGIRVRTNTTSTYYAFNKPRGVISTMDDPEGRPSIADYVKNNKERLFHVGRLDNETEGLLLLTNDGELANRLAHPRYQIPKTYLVQVRGPLAKGIGAQLREGIELEDGLAKVDSFAVVDSTPGHVLIEITLHSGKNRIVRRMFKEIGYPVQRLVRIAMGPITLGNQKQGSVRPLGDQEIGHLMAAVDL